MKKYIVFTFCFLNVLLFQNTIAQNINIKSIKFEQFDELIYSEKPQGKNLLVAGVQKQGTGYKASFIAAIDTAGNVLWKKLYTKTNADLVFSKITINKNNQIVVVGCEHNFSQKTSKPYAAVISESGTIVWENYFGQSELDKFTDVFVDDANDLYACGITKVQGEASTDVLVTKITAKGKKLWEANPGNKYLSDRGTCILNRENNLFVFGTTYSNVLNQSVMFSAKVDKRGTIISTKNYENIPADSAFAKFKNVTGLTAYSYKKNADNSYVNYEVTINENTLEAINVNPLFEGQAVLCDNINSIYLFKQILDKKKYRPVVLTLNDGVKKWYSFNVNGNVDAPFFANYVANTFYAVQNNSNATSEASLHLCKLTTGIDSYSAAKCLTAQDLNLDVIAEMSDDNAEISRGGNDPFKGLNVAKANDLKPGTYYALIIGVDNYGGKWTKLQNAVNDAKGLEQCLSANYRFDKITTIYNDQATRVNILNQLDVLAEKVKENDNVLIFYSGHGEYRKDLNKGYWVPVDAKSSNSSELISNLEIQSFLTALKSKHTLLITDACFGGEILRGGAADIKFDNTEKYYKEAYRHPSRKALTSGGVEPVSDGGKNNHSIFTYYVLKTLQGNPKKYFDAAELYNEIKVPVSNNSNQTPQFQSIKNAGDEGGQFIFIRK